MRWRLGIVTAALVAAFAPLPPQAVERFYTDRVFAFLQPSLTTWSNRVSFACLDLVILLVAAFFVASIVGDLRNRRARSWLRVLATIVLRASTVTAAAYLVFLMTWGLNYRRQPLAARLVFDTRKVTVPSAVTLAEIVVGRVNTQYATGRSLLADPVGTIDPLLAEAFGRAQQELGQQSRFVAGRPKRSLLDPYFVRAGVAGMTDPYLLETLVASDLLAVERPMVIAHEWAHLAGIADEGDANFSGWLTCLRGSPAHQYSAWLFLYGEVLRSLPSSDARRVAASLENGPRADLQAIRERILRHVSPRVSALGWQVYDRYLRANHVEEGAASYEQVVRLILGTEFGPDWTPKLRE